MNGDAAASELSNLARRLARDEAWKYTRPGALFDRAWALAGPRGEAPGPQDDATHVFMNGHGGSGAPSGRRAPTTAVAAMARSIAQGGADLTGGPDEVYARYVVSEPGRVSAVFNTLEIPRSSAPEPRLLVERFTGSGEALTLAVSELTLDAGAELVHVRLVEEGEDVLHHGTIDVEVGEGARYYLVSVVLGGATVRIEPTIRLAGPGARADLYGLVALRGRQHADHHVSVDHAAPGCTSRQVFRSLLDGSSRGVYTGNVRVRPGADGTDSGQVHRALLLSDDAVANARPQLEIEADDVKCAHGAAIGALDEEMLFYLQQRGLDRLAARGLLTAGFVRETIAAIPNERWRAHAEALFGARWET